jgi:hypothetical protein
MLYAILLLQVRPPRAVDQKGRQPMYQPDFNRRMRVAEEKVRELQQKAEHQQYEPDEPGSKSRIGQFVLGATLVLGIVLVLLFIVSLVVFVLLPR